MDDNTFELEGERAGYVEDFKANPYVVIQLKKLTATVRLKEKQLLATAHKSQDVEVRQLAVELSQLKEAINMMEGKGKWE